MSPVFNWKPKTAASDTDICHARYLRLGVGTRTMSEESRTNRVCLLLHDDLTLPESSSDGLNILQLCDDSRFTDIGTGVIRCIWPGPFVYYWRAFVCHLNSSLACAD